MCIFSIVVFLEYMPSSGNGGSYSSFIPSFKEISILLFIVAVSIYISTNCARGFSFLHILSSIYCFRVFDDGHSDQCEITLHCSFDFHFSNNEQCWVFFPVYWPCLLWRNVCLGLLQFFDWGFFSVSYFICSYFLPFWRLSLHLVYGSFAVQKLLSLIRLQLFIFVFISITVGGGS